MVVAFAFTVIVIAVGAWFVLKKIPPKSTQAGSLEGHGTYQIPVVGESRYQHALEEICGGRDESSAEKYCRAALVLENSNPYDNEAVRVDIEKQTVGYLTRPGAREYRRRLAKAGHPNIIGVCGAVIRGGWDRGGGDRGHFGVWLDLPTA